MPKTKIDSKRDLWISPDSYATSLLIGFLDDFGTEGLDWLGPTIEMEIKEHYQVEISPSNYNKLMAAISVLTTDSFYRVPSSFPGLVAALRGYVSFPGNVIIPDVTDTCLAIIEALLIHPPEEDWRVKIHPEIIGYIEHLLKEESIIKPPFPLSAIIKSGHWQEKIFQNAQNTELQETILSASYTNTQDIEEYIQYELTYLAYQLLQLPVQQFSKERIEKAILTTELFQWAIGQKLDDLIQPEEKGQYIGSIEKIEQLFQLKK